MMLPGPKWMHQSGTQPVIMLVSSGCAIAGTSPIWVVWLSTGVMVLFRPEILLRTMSGSVALPHPGAVLMSVAPEITDGRMRGWDV